MKTFTRRNETEEYYKHIDVYDDKTYIGYMITNVPFYKDNDWHFYPEAKGFEPIQATTKEELMTLFSKPKIIKEDNK